MAFDPQEHLIKVKGGQLYLEVRWRLIWFRELHPDASIEVELTHLDLDSKLAIARATVTLPNGTKATEIGSETERDFPAGWVEKAATKAVGRALAALGFGTQFAIELDEGERVVDGPVPAKGAQAAAVARPSAPTVTAAVKQPPPASDPYAALRAEVVGLLSVDTEAAGKLPKGAHAMTQQELSKTRTWLQNRAAEARAVATAQQEEPAPEPGPTDEHATLRAEVVALLAEDGPALALLQQQKKSLPPEQDGATLAKTKTWLLQRKEQRRPQTARLAERIARARAADEVRLVLTDARRAQEKKEVTEAEYKALYQAAEARKAELSAPLLAGTPGRAQVAS